MRFINPQRDRKVYRSKINIIKKFNCTQKIKNKKKTIM